MDKPNWIKSKTFAEGYSDVVVAKWDDYKDFKTDDGCYVLIKLLHDTYEIGVAVCNYKHEILKSFRGRRPQDIYFAIFKYSEDNKLGWFKRFDHAAYLGKELKKAEICLAMGSEYIQE